MKIVGGRKFPPTIFVRDFFGTACVIDFYYKERRRRKINETYLVLAPSWKTRSGKKMWQVLPDLSVFLRMCRGQGVENFLLTKLTNCDIVKERTRKNCILLCIKREVCGKSIKSKRKVIENRFFVVAKM